MDVGPKRDLVGKYCSNITYFNFKYGTPSNNEQRWSKKKKKKWIIDPNANQIF